MLQVSDAYKELVKSNIRPKCEPIVKVSGKDNNGNETEIVWKASNIKDLKYKRGIDPVGRELPYIELTWTEIYTGKLNAESYPEKYNNVTKYMEVELSFVQNLGFYNTWKTLFASGITWKELFASGMTWKQLKNQVSQETITMPKMFLTAKPTISGQTITWTARDLLYFLQENQVKSFAENISFFNPIKYFLLNERGNFLNAPQIFEAIQTTVQKIHPDIIGDMVFYGMDKKIIFNGSTKDIIMKYAQIRNIYVDFKENFITFKYLPKSELTDVVFSNKTMFDYPIIEKCSNISTFKFKSYAIHKQTDRKYTLPYTEVLSLKDNTVYRFDFDGYGEMDASVEEQVNIAEINRAWSVNLTEIDVIPLSWNAQDYYYSQNIIGEVYNEDNPYNPYSAYNSTGQENEVSRRRFDYLKSYFNENANALSFSSLPDLSVETGDMITVATNLFDENNQRILKTGVVVFSELIYNGSTKQSFIVHEREVSNGN